jgi:hypothetical protein
MAIEEDMREPRPAAGRGIGPDNQRLARRLAQACREAHGLEVAHQPLGRAAAVRRVGRIRADAGKAQQLEDALEALRELLIYFGENGVGMNQDATRKLAGLNRRNNVTAAAPAARVAA